MISVIAPHILSFDESLNKKLQKNQMDVQIRFWSDELNKAVTRYWGSDFQLNTDAVTLKENLLEADATRNGWAEHQLENT